MVNKNFVVMRMDMVSRVSYPRDLLLRFVKIEGKLTLDLSGNLPGRGYYLLNDENHIKEVFNKKKISRYLGNKNQEELLKEILESVKRN